MKLQIMFAIKGHSKSTSLLYKGKVALYSTPKNNGGQSELTLGYDMLSLYLYILFLNNSVY